MGLVRLMCVALGICVVELAPAQPAGSRDSLAEFLRKWVTEVDPSAEPDRTIRFIPEFVDLNGDGVDEAIVHLFGRSWCGSSGCALLILARYGASWKLVTDAGVARQPIRVLNTKSHGWRSLAVWVQGGGIQPGYEAELRFDGAGSVPPAIELKKRLPGRVVIRDDIQAGKSGQLLFP